MENSPAAEILKAAQRSITKRLEDAGRARAKKKKAQPTRTFTLSAKQRAKFASDKALIDAANAKLSMPTKRTRRRRRPPGQARLAQQVTVPAAVGSRIGGASRPRFETNGQTLIIHHTEYFTDMVGSVAFTTFNVETNPARAEMFPWLAGVVNHWEQYRFLSLRFHYNTFQPTTATGSVILAFDPDATDISPLSKAQALSFRDSSRSNTYLPMRLDVERGSLNPLWR